MKNIGKFPSTRELEQAANLTQKEIINYIGSLNMMSLDLIQLDNLMDNIFAMQPSDFRNRMIHKRLLAQSLISQTMCVLEPQKYRRIKQQLRKKNTKGSLFSLLKNCLYTLSCTLGFSNSWLATSAQMEAQIQMHRLNIQKLMGYQQSNIYYNNGRYELANRQQKQCNCGYYYQNGQYVQYNPGQQQYNPGQVHYDPLKGYYVFTYEIN